MLELFDMVAEAKGKEKIEIIQGHMSEALKLAFRYAYSPKIVYGIKEVVVPEEHGDTKLTYSNLHLTLEAVISSKTPQETLTNLLAEFDNDDKEVICRIIKKDLRIGMSAKSFNKAVGEDYVYIHPYNRCSSLNEKTAKKIVFPCYSQVKSDGKFADLMIEVKDVVHDGLVQPKTRFCNRDGVIMDILSDVTLERISETLLSGNPDRGSLAISGELLYLDENGDIMPRASGNGILNSDEIDESRVVFRVWDVRSVDSPSAPHDTYDKRLALVETLTEELSHILNIQLTPTVVCNTWDEIGEHYKECRLAGEEGTIVKNQHFLFKDGTSPECIKLKAIIEGDVRVVGVTEGEGKWAGVGVGSLLIESECGKMKCSASGLTDKQRVDYYNNPSLIVDSIIRVLYNAVVQREGEDTMALYLPRYDEVRDDKQTADTLERLLEQEAASIDILITWGV